MSKNSPRYRKSFTLIELLVVITIIAILAAILLPSLKTARQRAYMVSCQSNLKQLGIGCHLYYNDYGRFLPIPGSMTWTQDGGGNAQGWGLLVQGGYIKSKILAESWAQNNPYYDWTGNAQKSTWYACMNFWRVPDITDVNKALAASIYYGRGVGQGVHIGERRGTGGTVEGGKYINALYVDGSVQTVELTWPNGVNDPEQTVDR